MLRFGDDVRWFSVFQNRYVKGKVVEVYRGGIDRPYVLISWESGATPIMSEKGYKAAAKAERQRKKMAEYHVAWRRRQGDYQVKERSKHECIEVGT